MIRIIASEKGQGKTKRLLDMANGSVKTTDGHLVFIDDDSRHIYDLHYDIRFVDASAYPLDGFRGFIGFLCGILSQNSDIKEVFVDGLTNIIAVDDDELLKLMPMLEKVSSDNEVDFIIGINYKSEHLPEKLQQLVMA